MYAHCIDVCHWFDQANVLPGILEPVRMYIHIYLRATYSPITTDRLAHKSTPHDINNNVADLHTTCIPWLSLGPSIAAASNAPLWQNDAALRLFCRPHRWHNNDFTPFRLRRRCRIAHLWVVDFHMQERQSAVTAQISSSLLQLRPWAEWFSAVQYFSVFSLKKNYRCRLYTNQFRACAIFCATEIARVAKMRKRVVHRWPIFVNKHDSNYIRLSYGKRCERKWKQENKQRQDTQKKHEPNRITSSLTRANTKVAISFIIKHLVVRAYAQTTSPIFKHSRLQFTIMFAFNAFSAFRVPWHILQEGKMYIIIITFIHSFVRFAWRGTLILCQLQQPPSTSFQFSTPTTQKPTPPSTTIASLHARARVFAPLRP